MRRFVVALALLSAVLTALAAGFPSPASAAGAVVHVAVTGSDATGTGAAGAPYRTVGRGLLALTPGDTLVVHGGTYDERIKNPSIRPGTASAPIRVTAAAGEAPAVVRGLFWLANASSWTIDGLRFAWSDLDAPTEHLVKFSGGTGWRLTGSTIAGAHSYAGLLIAGDASAFRVDHNVIRDTAATNDPNQDHLIYVNAGMGGGVIESNVLANSPNGRGIKVGPPSAGTTPIGNLTIRFNTFFANLGPSNIQLSYGATGNVIEHNVFQRPASGRAAVTAYELNGSGNVVRDNVAWETGRVVELEPGVEDGGGNLLLDPGFVDPAGLDFRTTNPLVAGYGADATTLALASGVAPALPPVIVTPPPVTEPVVEPTAPSTAPSSAPTLPAQPAAGSGAAPAPLPAAAPTPTAAPTPSSRAGVAADRGYRMMAADGGIFTFGDAGFHGSTGNLVLNQPIVGGASTATGNGYWLVAADGGIFTFGDAAFRGSAGDRRLAQPVAAMAATPTGDGYWLVERGGIVHAFGDAPQLGNATGNVVGIAASRTGNGYWVVTTAGRVQAFGDAAALGSTPALNQPVVGMAATPSGDGYWVVARDGGIFTFGDAAFHGSTGDLRLNQPIVGLAPTTDGYRLVAADGGIFTFGDAAFLGSTGDLRLNRPILAFV